jgi:hypothetical protein
VRAIFDREEALMSKGMGEAAMDRLRSAAPVLPAPLDRAQQAWQADRERYLRTPNEFTKASLLRSHGHFEALVTLYTARPVVQPPGQPISSALGLLTAR